MSAVHIAAIIPARMGSTRLPGKPLLMIRGLPMVEHVRRRALLSKAFCSVVVATCDSEIADAVDQYGGEVLMTSPQHQAATDRVAEAMAKVECSHVVNLQGDEILVLPEDLAGMVSAIAAAPETSAWNATARIEQRSELADRAVVKCVVSRSNRILFCSRDFSALPVDCSTGARAVARPCSRAFNGGRFEPVRRILGVLAYQRSFLERYPEMERTPLELAESIDQSRIIEHDIPLQGVEFTRGYPGVNKPYEVTVVERYLSEDPAQREVLERIHAF